MQVGQDEVSFLPVMEISDILYPMLNLMEIVKVVPENWICEDVK